MAALTILAYNVFNQVWDLTDALLRTGFNINKSLRYLRAKQQHLLFHAACLAVWQLERKRDQVKIATFSACALKSENSIVKMRKQSSNVDNIDFAAIEAAYDIVDNPYAAAARDTHFSYEEDDFGQFGAIEVIQASENNTTFYDYASLPVFQDKNIGSLFEGISFTITGSILVNCERFSINFILANDTEDIALHINPRIPQNYIVRNTKANGHWGREEVSSALPFSLHRGNSFAIQVLVTKECYMISVNGYHFAVYNHRLPYTAVSMIEIKGDVENVKVKRSAVTQYPERLPQSKAKEIRLALTTKTATSALKTAASAFTKEPCNIDEIDATAEIPREWCLIRLKVLGASAVTSNKSKGLPLPYYGTLPLGSLIEGRLLKIEGRVNLLPHSFYINLQSGQNFWPHPTVAFHFNPRFSTKSFGAIGKAIVCRNAWYNGSWAQEERSELNTDFLPGKTFSMMIACTEDAFEVYVNLKLITTFLYKVKPEIVDTVYIQGDIKLWNVVLEKNSSDNSQNRIYQNPAYTEEQ